MKQKFLFLEFSLVLRFINLDVRPFGLPRRESICLYGRDLGHYYNVDSLTLFLEFVDIAIVLASAAEKYCAKKSIAAVLMLRYSKIARIKILEFVLH